MRITAIAAAAALACVTGAWAQSAPDGAAPAARAPTPAAAVTSAGVGIPAGIPGGPQRSRREIAALAHPGMTRCATLQDFLAYRDLKCPQTGGLPLPPASSAQLEKNKELVLRFYQGDTHVMADDFIQHDPAEPSTRKAWVNFFSYRRRTAASTPRVNLGGFMGYGKVPVDSTGSPVQYLVAEGDIVVAMRFRWWPWEGGPEPVYKGLFVDVWRIKDGKLAEQWCTATPEDASARGIELAKKEGAWVKFKNMNEQ